MAREKATPPRTRGKAKPKDTSRNGGPPNPEDVEVQVEVPEGEPANGVLIHRVFQGENGTDIGTAVQLVGDVKLTEVLTILGIASKQVKQQLGIE